MNTLFDNDMRVLNESELIYEVTNRKDVSLMDDYTFEDIINTLTPGRKRVALAAVELYNRLRVKPSDKIVSSIDVYHLMAPVLEGLNHEELWLVLLNQACRPIKRVRISIGGIASTGADIRLMMKEAFSCCAISICILHNHPSGVVRPSAEDDKFTKHFADASKMMDIRLMDHVIIGNGSYYSYADEGRL